MVNSQEEVKQVGLPSFERKLKIFALALIPIPLNPLIEILGTYSTPLSSTSSPPPGGPTSQKLLWLC